MNKHVLDDRSKNSNILFSYAIPASVFLICCILYLPTAPFPASLLFNDDVQLLQRLGALDGINEKLGFIFNPQAQKFRPLANLQYLLEYLSFGTNTRQYLLYNLSLIAIAITLALRHARKLDPFVLLLAAATLACSKFFIYEAWNITGSFEALATLLFVMLITALSAGSKSRTHIMMIAVALILTSERYLPFIMLVPFWMLLKSPGLQTKALLKALAFSAMILLIYGAARTFMHVPVFVGTQTDNISESLSLRRVAHHVFSALIELAGGSVGPRYLTGVDFVDWVPLRDLDQVYVFIATMELLAVLTSVQLFAFRLFSSRTRNDLMLLLAVGALVLAASVTFRLELRWLAPGYLGLWIYFLGHDRFVEMRRSRFKNVVLGAFLLANLSYNLTYQLLCRESLHFALPISRSTIPSLYIQTTRFRSSAEASSPRQLCMLDQHGAT